MMIMIPAPVPPHNFLYSLKYFHLPHARAHTQIHRIIFVVYVRAGRIESKSFPTNWMEHVSSCLADVVKP